MQLKSNPLFQIFLAINVASLGVVASIIVSQRILSDGAIAARNKGLVAIAQHLKASTCWKSENDTPFKLGDDIATPGSDTGKIPTQCVFAPKNHQFLQVAYLNGQLRVVQVYSATEVRNQSTIKDIFNDRPNSQTNKPSQVSQKRTLR